MKDSVGKVDPARLYCSCPGLMPTELRKYFFDVFVSSDDDKKNVKRGFTAIGQFVGLNGEETHI